MGKCRRSGNGSRIIAPQVSEPVSEPPADGVQLRKHPPCRKEPRFESRARSAKAAVSFAYAKRKNGLETSETKNASRRLYSCTARLA